MENKKTYYQLILDKSGSMSSCIEETIAGVNSQVRRIKEIAERFPGQEIYTSLCLFNQNVTSIYERQTADQLSQIGFHHYRPAGSTALYDAVGNAVTNLQQAIGHEVDKDEASVVVVIFTDGYENSSRQYSHQRISSLIKELEETGRWSFTYVGATLDAVDIAINLNIKRKNATRYDVKESMQSFNNISNYMERYVTEKSMGRKNIDFGPIDPDDR